jgi:predicted dehydrogenase
VLEIMSHRPRADGKQLSIRLTTQSPPHGKGNRDRHRDRVHVAQLHERHQDRERDPDSLAADDHRTAAVRIAVVGLGYWGPNLVRNLMGIDECETVVACDVVPDRVKAIQRLFPGVAGNTCYEEVLQDSSVAGVVVATPVLTHASLALQAIRAGKDVLVEKPLATSGAQARQLIDEATSRGLLAMTGHTFLYSPPVMAVRDMLASGALGEPVYVHSSRVNLGIHRSDVSVLWDLAPHDLSILVYWLGEMPRVVSVAGRATYASTNLDVAFVDLEFPSGVVANLHLSWLAPTKVRRMTLVCSEKMVVYEDTNAEEPIKVYDRGVSLPNPASFGEYRLSYRTGDMVAPRIEAWEPLRKELEDFVTRINANDTCGEAEVQALQVVTTIESAERSLSMGGSPVTVGPLAVAEAGG